MDIDELLRYAVERGASDLHLKAGNVPYVRVDGELSPADLGYLSAADTDRFASAVMTEHKQREFERTSEADLGYTLSGVGRFPSTCSGSARPASRAPGPRGGAVVRGARLPAVMATLAGSPRGFDSITGPTGTGKTTTIAATIGHINRTRRAHIVTVEDPIEVVHDDQLSIVQQREIGIDTDSYEAAPARDPSDPDATFIGEIRDSRLRWRHPGGRDRSPSRPDPAHDRRDGDDQPRPGPFPPEQREIRSSFAGALRHRVAAPRRSRDGKGRAGGGGPRQHRSRLRPIVDPDETAGILEAIADGDFYGMQTFDQAP